jgi:hypothetical protein
LVYCEQKYASSFEPFQEFGGNNHTTYVSQFSVEGIMKGTSFVAVGLAMISAVGWGQTNPTPQPLPYTQDFSALAHSSTAYPDGWQGWSVGSSSSSSFRLNAATADVALTASSSASTTAGGVHNYNGKIGILASTSVDPSVVLSIETTGKTNVQVRFDIMTIRNPYNGTTNTRINQVDMQYRVGTSGNFASVSGLANGIYENSTTTQTGSGVTTPLNLQTAALTLPSACDNQSVVQIRWVQRDVSGSGSRPSFAVDNIVVGTVPVVTADPLDHAVCSGGEGTFTASANGVPTPTVQWQVSTNSGATWSDLAGETNTTLTFAVSLSQNGNQYRAVFTNALGSATTGAAALTVHSPSSGGTPTAAEGVVCNGSSTTVSLGGQVGQIQKWQYSTDGGLSWTDIASTDNPLNTGSLAQTTMFRAEVKSGVCAAVFSDAVSVAVDALSIGGNATAAVATVSSGSGTTITLSGHNGAIQWQSSADGVTFSDLVGETAVTLNTGPLTATTHFRAVVTSGVCPSANSTVAVVTVNAPPIFGTISGAVSRSGGSGLANVIVKLLDNGMLPLSDVVTNSVGEYSFSGLTPATYNIMIVEPLGYLADANPKQANVVDATPVDVDFTLSQLVASNNAQKRPYWKHQFDVHVRGHGRYEETAAQLQSYIDAVQQHYTPHFPTVFGSALTFAAWQEALSRDRGIPPYIDKAMMELAALVLNMASLKLGQYTVVTDDGRTAGDVLTFVSQLFTDPDVTRRDYNKVRELAKKVNDGKTIRAGEVPPGSILYKQREFSWGFEVPTEFALHQNYPNPFNPSTAIEFSVASASGGTGDRTKVTLKVYDVLGREIATLVNESLQPGRYKLTFDATGLASGVYLYRLRAGEFTQTKRMMLLR